MKYFLLVFTLFFSFAGITLFSQNLNMELLDHRNDFGDLLYTDVWGYAEKDGTEYAIIGTRGGVVIYQILLDGKLKAVKNIAGDYSPWRDIKSYGDYIFAIADRGDDGLLIINMKKAPEAFTWRFWKPFLSINGAEGTLTDCHNLWVDENGILYLSGCNLNKGGILMADLSQNPEQPVYLGAADARYSHDCFARDNLLYSADLNSGSFSITDISEKSDPLLLAQQRTGGRFTHNVWLSDDGRYLFTTDEVADAATEAYDIQNLNNIVKLGEYRPAATLGKGVIPHNVHYFNGYLVLSHYTDGVKIIDAHRPENLVEVGSYDTWLGKDGGFHGCWGAYPYLPSGRILASNIEDGIYIMEATYQRAAYLEGQVRDAVTGANLIDVQVKILSDQPNVSFTNLGGQFKTGQVLGGTFTVSFQKEGYERTRVEVSIKKGEISILDVEMKPLPEYTIKGIVKDARSGNLIPHANISIRNDLSDFVTQADEQGAFTIGGVFREKYDLFAAGWGYLYQELPAVQIEGEGPYEILLEPGYQDDFLFDLGWQTEAETSVRGGFWEWSIPKGTFDSGRPSNPGKDLPDDFGEKCYMTGNGGGGANRDDVDRGTVTLTSPPMDLTIYDEPILTYFLWFYNSITAGDDSLKVYLSNGVEKVLIEQLTEPQSEWRFQSRIQVRNFLAPSTEMYLILETADQRSNDDVVEAAIDGFHVFELEEVTDIETPTPSFPGSINLYPNPGNGPVFLEFEIDTPVEKLELELYDLTGQRLIQWEHTPVNSGRITLNQLPQNGLFLLHFRVNGNLTTIRKLVRF